MKEQLKAGANHAANYGAGGGLAYGIVKVAERLGVVITAEEAILLAGACIWVWHRVRPLLNALYSKVLSKAGIALVVLLTVLPVTAEATDLAIGLRCEEGQTFAVTSSTTGCLHHDLELDVLVGGQIVGLLLTGDPGRVISLGGASLGLKFVYQPKNFALPEAVGLFLTLTGSLINIAGTAMSDGLSGRFEGIIVFGLTALSFWYGGVGPYLAVDDGKVIADLILSTGFTIPI